MALCLAAVISCDWHGNHIRVDNVAGHGSRPVQYVFRYRRLKVQSHLVGLKSLTPGCIVLVNFTCLNMKGVQLLL